MVRSALNHEYIKVVISSVASIGIHLIEPFYVKTISIDATHHSLKEFFTSLYDSLRRPDIVDRSFFEFNVPKLDGVSSDLFAGVKKDAYGHNVVTSVKQIASAYENECISLVKVILPDLAEVLARQRGKYYGFGDYPSEYPVFDQVEGGRIDKAPVNNLEMERRCGDMDNKLKRKSNNLEAASSSIVINKVFAMMPDLSELPDFHTMGPVVKKIDEIKMEWSERQKVLSAAGLNNKEAELLLKEQKKLNDLQLLRDAGGPYVSADEVDTYLAGNDEPTIKSQRMRREVSYARDTSVSFPRSHAVFRIMNTSVKPRRLLTPHEFGENLKIYLGKKEGRNFVTMDDYRQAVADLSNT